MAPKQGAIRNRPAASIKAKTKRTSSKSKPSAKPKLSLQTRPPSRVSFRSLTFGRHRQPSTLVVLFHGLNDSAKCCSDGVAEPWARGLPGAQIVVPESPDRSPWSSAKDPGYTWIPFQDKNPWEARSSHGTASPEFKKSVSVFHKSTMARCQQLGSWLDDLLAKHHLSEDCVILAGFSQGAMPAAILGAHRKVRGVIVCGGVPYAGFLQLGKLMPKKSTTRFCSINGTNDEYIERAPLVKMLRPYQCKWHWFEGQGHDFPDEWYEVGLAWMQQLLGQL